MKKGGLGPWKNVEQETIENVVLKQVQDKGGMHEANVRVRRKNVYVVSISVQKPALERSSGGRSYASPLHPHHHPIPY
jgi:hypothetical protein